MCPRPRFSKPLAFLAFAFALVAGLGACSGGAGSAPSSSSPTPSATSPDLVPANGVYLGAFINNGTPPPPPLTPLTAFEGQIHRTMAITQHYYGFYDTFPGTAEDQDVAAGRIPIESWDCGLPNSAVISGSQDAAIRRRADAIKAFGHPLFLRYMWEMNLPATPTFRQVCHSATTDEPNGIFSSVQFVGAWDRIRGIFAQEGVSNVVWLWNPSGSNDPRTYYPGPAETDWVGVDKYDDANVSFLETYAQAYGYLAPYGKPILIGETGAAATIQPQFFGSAAATLQSAYPLVKGYVYFDSTGFTNDWGFSPQGMAAFETMASNPYFSAKGP
jgi:hypothetical protein